MLMEIWTIAEIGMLGPDTLARKLAERLPMYTWHYQLSLKASVNAPLMKPRPRAHVLHREGSVLLFKLMN